MSLPSNGLFAKWTTQPAWSRAEHVAADGVLVDAGHQGPAGAGLRRRRRRQTGCNRSCDDVFPHAVNPLIVATPIVRTRQRCAQPSSSLARRVRLAHSQSKQGACVIGHESKRGSCSYSDTFSRRHGLARGD
jgi:hypothetical protein